MPHTDTSAHTSRQTHLRTLALFLLAGTVIYGVWQQQQPTIEVGASTKIGDARYVLASYEKWKQTQANQESPYHVAIALGWSKSLSTEHLSAHGTAVFDIKTSEVSISSTRLRSDVDVWLVDNRTGNGTSVLPENEDRLVFLGTLLQNTKADESTQTYSIPTDASFDVIVLAEAGRYPTTSRLLTGSLTLFQRFYISEYQRHAPPSNQASLVNASAFRGSASHNLTAMVELGERLFFEETFDGNGRTCGTCHRLENNFTIDPAFIATLPDDDPLFIAEFNDSLNARTNGGRWFENPQLMRSHGLIVANVDGFDDLANKFTMRSVPYTLGMAVSLKAGVNDGTTQPPNQRTGWSGDGAPGSGTLREFAIGAVTQHFPKTLSRRPGADFRLPTEEELDAMEAFQLSLGRQEELDITELTFNNATVTAGQDVFLNEGKCNSCHFNAGANFFLATDQNFNFDTGVEDQRRPRRRGAAVIPRDGGFGQDGTLRTGFGNGTFNTPSLIEAADTAPFFHDHSAETLEDAIDFYNTNAFNNSSGGIISQGISINRQQVRQVAAFLRAINALENIREATTLLTRARALPNSDDTHTILVRAQFECADAREVWALIEEDENTAPQGRGGRGRGGRNRGGAPPASPSIDAQFERMEGLAQQIVRAVAQNNTQERNRLIDEALNQLGVIQQNITAPAQPPQPGQSLETETLALHNLEAQKTGTLPESFALEQNYPNPFNPTTTIRFSIPEQGHVTVRIFNSQGQLIHVLAQQIFTSGSHELIWDAGAASSTALPSGTYFYELVTSSSRLTKSMILLK